MLAFILLALPLYCHAGHYLLVKSGDNAIYTRFEKTLFTTLKEIDKKNQLTTSDVKKLGSQTGITDITHYDAIISAGVDASIAISNLKFNKTIIMAMLPKSSYLSLSKTKQIRCKNNCQIIFLEQPIHRQLLLINLAFPDSKRIAVIGSDYSWAYVEEISRSAAMFGLILKPTLITDENSVLTALNKSLENTDVLMAIPDPVVFNRNTARAILLSAFHKNIPLFAYSSSFVQAGATIGLYSSPEDIAKCVTDSLSRSRSNKMTQHTIYPKYFTIKINQRAADALDIVIPDKKYLENRLIIDEK